MSAVKYCSPSHDSKWNTVKRGAAYSLAAGAAVTTIASDANAQVVYSGLQNIAIGQFGSQDLNLDGDGYNDILLKNYVYGANYQGATVNFYPGKVVGFNTGLSYATALGAGFLVDSAATAGGPFQVSLAYANNPNSQFDDVTDAYIGLEFPSGPNNYFGWIRVDIDNVAGTFLVKDWAYESQPGVGIRTGEIPEPTTLGLLAAGALGVAALRRRKPEAH